MRKPDLSDEHLRQVTSAFSNGPGLTLRKLADAAQVGETVLMPSYGSRRSPETIAKIAKGVASLLEYDESQVTAFLMGETDPALQDLLRELPGLRQCSVCKGWFKRKQMVIRLSRCLKCNRERKNPALQDWILHVDSKIDQAPEHLRSAWLQAKADQSRAITDIRLAMLAQRSTKQFRKEWKAAQLPAKRSHKYTSERRRSHFYSVQVIASLWRARRCASGSVERMRIRRARDKPFFPSQVALWALAPFQAGQITHLGACL